jgi:dipeptidyl aminopeptidase/acylaminoacyl peptidase
MLRSLIVITIVAGGLSATAPAIAADSPTPLKVDDLVGGLGFQHRGVVVAFSPDGTSMASVIVDHGKVIARADRPAFASTAKGGPSDSVGADIWLLSASDGSRRNLTNGAGNNWGPAWSPDGRWLAFYSDRDGQPNVWVWERETDACRRISTTVTRTFYGYEVPLWTPDSRQVIVSANVEGESQHEVQYESGTPISGPSPAIDKEPGSTLVLYESPRPPSNSSVDSLVADIAIIDIHTGATTRIVRRVHGAAYKLRLSPNGRLLTYKEWHRFEGQGVSLTLMVVDVVSGERRVLVPDIHQKGWDVLNWSPDSQWVAYIADDPTINGLKRTTRYLMSSSSDASGNLFVVPAAGGAARRFDGAPNGVFQAEGQAPLWDARSAQLYLVAADRIWRATLADGKVQPLEGGAIDVRTGQVRATESPIFLLQAPNDNQIWSSDDGRSIVAVSRNRETLTRAFQRVDLATGRSTSLLESPSVFGGLILPPVVSPNGRQIVYPSQSSTQPLALWTVDSQFRQPKILIGIAPELDTYRFGASRVIEFTSHDGERLHAALLLPSDYVPGRRYPTIVWVYPGVAGSEYANYFGLAGRTGLNLQMLATRGYAVLSPDIPITMGTPMQDLMKAVMPAVDRAVEIGVADADRLAVMGQSGGGYATLALIVQTRRFKAAVVNAGIADNIGYYAWNPVWLEQLAGGVGAAPWDAPERYISSSPVFHLNRIDTPLLMQDGSADQPHTLQCDELFANLQRLGKTVTYLRYDGESHLLEAPANLKDYWKRVLAFLARHTTT